MTVLTMNVVNDYNSSEGGFWFFTLFQWMGFLLQYIFWAYIDDIPPDVAVQLKRTEFLRNQIFDKKVNTHISDVVNRLRKLKESQEIQSPHQADVSKKWESIIATLVSKDEYDSADGSLGKQN